MDDTTTTLDMLGLHRPFEMDAVEGTDVAMDSFHLLSQVWPYALGQHLFDWLADDLNAMVYGDTWERYEAAYGRIVTKLGSNPETLEYIKDYYEHPERFACYYIRCIPGGNLGKSSSQPAEANHVSIIAHLGPGSTQDMVIQIKDILGSRQTELDNVGGETELL